MKLVYRPSLLDVLCDMKPARMTFTTNILPFFMIAFVSFYWAVFSIMLPACAPETSPVFFRHLNSFFWGLLAKDIAAGKPIKRRTFILSQMLLITVWTFGCIRNR